MNSRTTKSANNETTSKECYHARSDPRDAEAADLLRKSYPPLTDADAAALIRLCVGLPLALRLAASHLALDAADHGGQADVAGYLKKLSASLLTNLDVDAPDAGEITIQETLRLSIQQLEEAERRAWEKLAIFTASFRAEAAKDIAGADETMLTSFLRRSILEADGSDRYRLHDLAADYARRSLNEEEISTLTLAHAAHYTKVAGEGNRIHLEGDEVAGLALFDRERTQIECAWQALVKRTDAPADNTLILLVSCVYYAIDLRFQARDFIAWQESQLHASRRVGDRRSASYALGNLGIAHRDLGDWRTAIQYFEQSLAVSREIGDLLSEGEDLGNLGISHGALDELRTAIGYFEQSLEIARKLGNRRGAGTALWYTAMSYHFLGERPEALQCAEMALTIREAMNDPHAAEIRNTIAEWKSDAAGNS